MAIPKSVSDREIQKFVESTSVAGQTGVVVLNADGSGISGGGGGGGGEVTGNVAANAADSGKPVKTGGVYSATLPTLDDGDRGNTQVDSRGRTIVTLGTGLDPANDEVAVSGDFAHDATDGGKPVKVGYKADTTFPTAVQDGDRVDSLGDVYGVAQTRNDHPNRWSYHLDTSTAQTDTQVQAAPGTGLSVYITDIIFSNGAATAINLFFEEATTKILGPFYLEAAVGRGMIVHFKQPKKVTANTAVTLTTSSSTAHTVDIQGFIAP